MVSVRMRWFLLVLMMMVAGCGNALNDLYPSGEDKRVPVVPGSTGPAVGQQAPDFTLPDTLGGSVTLSSVVTTSGVQGTVLYFTMWCPICQADMGDIRNVLMPQYPNVRFFAVDYVSGTVTDARSAEATNGFTGSGFTVLADTRQLALSLYQATMATTVVIDSTGVIRMNEGYKFTRLQTALSGLP